MNHEETIKQALKDAWGVQGIEHAVIIIRDSKGGFHQSFHGDSYMLNGMLDYAKRDMFLRIYSMNEKHRREGNAKEERKNV